MRTGTIAQDMGESQASTWGLLDTFDKVTATSQWNLAHESWLGEVLVGIVIYFLAFYSSSPFAFQLLSSASASVPSCQSLLVTSMYSAPTWRSTIPPSVLKLIFCHLQGVSSAINARFCLWVSLLVFILSHLEGVVATRSMFLKSILILF